MATPQNSLYDALAEDAKKIRELGKSWGLDDADIDGCFQRALVVDKAPIRPRRSRVCRCLVLSFVGIFVLLIVLYGLVNFHKPSKHFAMRHAQDVLYPFMRAVRRAALPLRQVFDLSGLHELDCLVPNPLFGKFDEFDCWPCEEIREVRTFRNLSNFTMYYYHSGIPFVVKDANMSQVTFDDVKSVYLDNAEQFSHSASLVQSNNAFIRSISDLLTPSRTLEDLLGTDFHLQWRVLKAGGVRLIRSMSPKPYFVPEKAEVASEMFVMIHTPAAEAHPLPLPEHPNAWLTQACGSQEVALTPVSACKENCTEVRIVLQQSDVLFYTPRFWQLNAFSFGNEVSIAFQGSFF
ncbi:uncharacterized protein LOC110975044 [Acanthaster planci]|uniref:Uncharacterized protein LOC110975044 n=1 Tax=Acanthaster planci TaxID=133434 RepID=A0A8B7XS97_ACAPL|nr:uncharacterized protein LOC110975044 [Acanthaster planci]